MVVPPYQATADLLRVLGHPARIRVLELLAERDHAAAELLERIPIEAGSLSQQLAVLRRAGVVGQRRQDGAVVYTLLVQEVRGVLLAARLALEAIPGGAPGNGETLTIDLRTTPATGLPGGAAALRSAGSHAGTA